MKPSLAVALALLLAGLAAAPAQDKPAEEFKVEPGRTAEEYYNIGNWYAERDQHFRAIAYYKAAIAKDADLTIALVNMGASYRAVGKPADAVEAYKSAIDAGFEENFVYLNLGNAYIDADELRQAVIAFRTFIALEPYDPDGYANLGITLYRLGDYAQAAEAFEKLILLEKDNAYFLFQAARCYALLEQHDKTLEKVKAALAIDPNIRYALLQDEDFRKFRRSQQYRTLLQESRPEK